VGFFRTWRDRSLDTLTQYIQAEMPLASKGSLSLRVVSEIVAHWLATVGYPAGDVELPTTLSEQRSITIVRR